MIFYIYKTPYLIFTVRMNHGIINTINTFMTEVKLAQHHQNSNILNRISQLLMKKAYQEGRAQTEDNKTSIGGVNFWFSQAKEGGSYLIYDSNPETWTKDKLELITNDIEKLEWYMIYRHSSY